MNNLIDILINIYKMVEYYKTEGEYNINNNIKINLKNKKDIYETLDFFENYILNYNLYVYDYLNQEIFLKLLKNKKINSLTEILDKKLEEIKEITKNKDILIRIQYILNNSYKIKSLEKLNELINILKKLKINTEDIENLYFMIYKLGKIKNNNFADEDLINIYNFSKKFNINIKKDINELILDKNNIDYLHKVFKKEINEIKNNNIIDKLINYLDNKN